MNPLEALGIAFWVIVFAVIIGVVASGGWSGLTSWVAAKFGPVGSSSSSSSGGQLPGVPTPSQLNNPGTWTPGSTLQPSFTT